MRTEPDHLPPLDLLLAFEAAARHLSFTRAGAERFVTQSAISRQIRALEDELGTPLFARRHRALELTPEGQKLLLACTVMLAQLRKAVATIRAPARREVLALSTTPSFASMWLIPRLLSFTQAQPGVDVRLDASFALRDLRADGFDLAVRYAPSNAAEGKRLFGETMLPVCAPGLLRAKGMQLKSPEDLQRHTLLQITSGATAGMPMEWELWLRAHGLPELQPRSTLSFSNYNEVVAAAVAGQGVALGRRPLIDTLLRQRKLVAPFGEARSTARAYFVITDAVARTRPAVRALEEWLLAEAARTPAAGRSGRKRAA